MIKSIFAEMVPQMLKDASDAAQKCIIMMARKGGCIKLSFEPVLNGDGDMLYDAVGLPSCSDYPTALEYTFPVKNIQSWSNIIYVQRDTREGYQLFPIDTSAYVNSKMATCRQRKTEMGDEFDFRSGELVNLSLDIPEEYGFAEHKGAILLPMMQGDKYAGDILVAVSGGSGDEDESIALAAIPAIEKYFREEFGGAIRSDALEKLK